MKNKILLFSILFLILTFSSQLYAQNYALQLDGIDDKIGVADNTVLNPTDALTVEVWIKADNWESSVWAGTIIGKQATSPDRGYCLTVGENGRAEFTVSIDGLWKAVSTSQIMGLGTWYHIAGVYDGSTSKIYINSVLQNTLDISSGNHDPAGGTSLILGDNPTWTGRNFEGTVDDVRIWDLARTQTEIADNFITELIGNEAGLVAYWKMNEGTGSTTITDATVNGNTGTLLNMDENTDWVDGFEIPGDDVGVLGVVSPYSLGPDFTSEESVKVEIKNFSTDPVTNFDVNYELNGDDPVTENISETIEAFGTYIHTFSAVVDLSGQTSCEIKAYTSLISDGNNDNDTIISVITPSESAMIFDDEQHSFGSHGQTHNSTLYINDDLSGYSHILLNIDLYCPAGGCDPWDQPAFFYILHEGEKYEIARYITPYGVACGGWTFDITDFKSILTGSVNFESYIQVWGASGWLLDAEIVLVPGTPAYESSTIDILCIEEYWVYGDLAVNPHNPPANTVSVDPDVDAVKIRMTTTGHGQGNTDNAAEFKEVIHSIFLNDSEAFTQHLWKDDCNVNECSPQNGTWLYSRAGWCPGQDVQPWEWDLNGLYIPGEDLMFEYRLQDYTNFLNTGYNGSSHTEPHYKIHTYLVSYFTPLVDIEKISQIENGLDIYPNPTADVLNFKFYKDLKGQVIFEFYNIYGQLIYSENTENIRSDVSHSIRLDKFPSGIYTVKIKSDKDQMSRKIVVKK